LRVVGSRRDRTGWCRLPHAVLCPARPAPEADRELAGLRRVLAVNTRRLIDAGVFTPPSASADRLAPVASECRPARPIVQILYVRYLAAGPVDAIQCVAQTRRRHRCTSPVLAPEARGGQWTLMPVAAEVGQLALPAETMASTASPPCLTGSNCAGAPSAARSMPPLPLPLT
jgi:hypothetical protein